MPRNTTPLALVALLVIVAASMAALAGNRAMGPASREPAPSAPTGQASRQATRRAAVDPVEVVARSYALAARNWTPSSYQSSWERQIELAGGGYRRALRAKRPGRRELAALRQDHAGSKARVLRTERDRRVSPPNARVLVTLDETTSAQVQIVRGITVNEASLRQQDGQWRVIGWTVIPGA